MKHDRISIKWSLFKYLLIFAALMLALLWVFQTVLLERIYKSITLRNIYAAAQTICDNIDEENASDIIDSLARQYSLCIRITDNQGADVYSIHTMDDCVIHRMPRIEMLRFYVEAQHNGGKAFELFTNQMDRTSPGSSGPETSTVSEQSILYAQLVTRADGTVGMVMVNATLSPVLATVQTLRLQLLWITGILVVLALLLALLMSRTISRPIIKINKSAKELALGNYDTVFDGHGYLEASELSATLNYAAKELSKVDGLRRELIANVSHDLRTPLTMIVGFGEVMRDLPGENTPDNAQIIVDEAKRLSLLVNDMLDLSKIQSGSQAMDAAAYNLTHSVRDIVNRCARLTRQEGYRLEFIHDGEAWVLADELKMGQVIYNLVSNAINYTGSDKTVRVTQTLEDGWVRIDVEDTGEGIPDEQLPLIWDRYYKVDKTHRRAVLGTGLGLAIVKGVLNLHNARYGVQSAQNQGSCFWFALPTVTRPEGEQDTV